MRQRAAVGMSFGSEELTRNRWAEVTTTAKESSGQTRHD